MNETQKMRRFYLIRHADVTGISGMGVVAEGVCFTDGIAVLRWLSEHRTTVVHDKGMASVRAIHGHVGQTEIVYIDPDPYCLYCQGYGTSDNAHCHCYGPRGYHTAGNLEIRDRYETAHGY